MKFSLLYEMQLDSPSAERETKLFHDAVAQAELADTLGYHCVWAVEHHGLHQYSHSSAPEVFLAFVAARTQRIRLGHGVALLPCRYNHPIRVAERAAALDILSQGRVNFGTGKGSSWLEQRAFEIDPAVLSEQWEEALRMIVKMWREEIFEYQSAAFTIPPMHVLPKPVQKPHPPLYVACTSAGSSERAADLGLGALNFSLGTRAQIGEKVQAYRNKIVSAKAIGAQVNNHFACAPVALVLPDDKQACRYGYRGAKYFSDALDHYTKQWHPGAEFNVRAEFLPDDKLMKAMSWRQREDNAHNALCGDPAFARQYVQQFVDLGVDELILVMQMGTIPSELVLESVKTFGEQVIPHFG